MIVENNIFLTNGTTVYLCVHNGLQSNSNTIWDISGKEPILYDYPQPYNLQVWKQIYGKDEDSIVKNPEFKDPENGDFSFA